MPIIKVCQSNNILPVNRLLVILYNIDANTPYCGAYYRKKTATCVTKSLILASAAYKQ
jgi:hypothetical protein